MSTLVVNPLTNLKIFYQMRCYMPVYEMTIRVEVPVPINWDLAKDVLEETIRQAIAQIAQQYMVPPTPENIRTQVEVYEV